MSWIRFYFVAKDQVKDQLILYELFKLRHSILRQHIRQQQVLGVVYSYPSSIEQDFGSRGAIKYQLGIIYSFNLNVIRIIKS